MLLQKQEPDTKVAERWEWSDPLLGEVEVVQKEKGGAVHGEVRCLRSVTGTWGGRVWKASPEETVTEVGVQELELVGDGWTIQTENTEFGFLTFKLRCLWNISSVQRATDKYGTQERDMSESRHLTR